MYKYKQAIGTPHIDSVEIAAEEYNKYKKILDKLIEEKNGND